MKVRLVVPFLSILILHMCWPVRCQTMVEMGNAVRDAYQQVFWPSLHCVPHGWTWEFGSFGYNSHPQSLINAGFKSLYKLDRIRITCNTSVDNKEIINDRWKREGCFNHCVLRHLGFLKDPWDKNVTPGDFNVALANMRELLTADLQPTQTNLSAELAAETATRHIFTVLKAEIALSDKPISCLDNHFGNFIQGTIHHAIGNPPTVECYDDNSYCWSYDPTPCRGFPQIMFSKVLERPVTEEDRNLKDWTMWPNFKCLNEQLYQAAGDPDENQQEHQDKIISLNTYCRDMFNINQFVMKKEFGGEKAVEGCAKLCILGHLVNYERYNIKDGLFLSKVQILQGRGREAAARDGMAEYLTRFNAIYENKQRLRMMAPKLVNFMNKSIIDNGLADGMECWKVDTWTPVFRDFQTFFDAECNTWDPASIPENYWPNMSCVAGWHKAKGNPTHPAGPGRSRMLNITGACEDSEYREYYEGSKRTLADQERCKKKCILDDLNLIKYNYETGLEPTPLQTFLNGLKSVMTDRGGSVATFGRRVYFALKQSKIWSLFAKYKWCTDVEWDQLFAVVDDVIEKESVGKC